MEPRRGALARWLGLAAAAAVALGSQAEAQPAPWRGDDTALLQTSVGTAAGREEQAPLDLSSTGLPVHTGSHQQILQNFGDAQYVAYLTVGRQTITGVMDTGSSDLVVFGSDCDSCGTAAHYSAHFSKTYAQGHVLLEQRFGGGAAVSVLARERVSIGPYTLPMQGFWNVQQAQMPVLSSAAFEAIVGVGPPEVPLAKAWRTANDAVDRVVEIYERSGRPSPEAEEAVEQAKTSIHAALEIVRGPPMLAATNCTAFSVCIGAAPGSDGLFVWNDTVALEQPHLFTRVPVVGQSSWTATLTGGGIRLSNDGVGNLTCPDGCNAILDTGSSVLGVPGEVIAAINEAMENLDEDCSNVDVLPSLVFKLGGAEFSLPPDAYLAEVSGDVPEFLQDRDPEQPAEQQPAEQPEEPARRERKCQLMLVETNATSAEDTSWILGVPFFRKYYTTFYLGHSPAARAFFIAPHGADECAPAHEPQAALLREEGQGQSRLRRVPAERIRLSLMAQRAAAGARSRRRGAAGA